MAVHFFAFIGGIVIGHQHYEHWHHASVGQKNQGPHLGSKIPKMA